MIARWFNELLATGDEDRLSFRAMRLELVLPRKSARLRIGESLQTRMVTRCRFCLVTRNAGSSRLVELASQRKVHDTRLWTEIAALSGGAGNSTSLVGTPDQVAEAALDYYNAGVTTFLFRGFEQLRDAVEYGQDLLPRIRALVKEQGTPRTSATPRVPTVQAQVQ